LADQVGETIGEVVSSIEEVEERTDEIAAASEEQSTTSEEIARSVQSISTAAQESAAGVTEVSGAADDLERVTERLRKGVDAFVLEDGGTDHRSSGRATSHRPESRSSHSGDSPEERPMKGGNGRAASHVS
jgi:methyl-accepting chemotaxis protein